MKKSKYLTKELVTRNNQFPFMNYISMLPNPDRVLRRSGKTIDAYRELKDDPHVWSCIQSRKSGLMSLENTLVKGSSSDAVFRIVSEMLGNIDIMQLERDVLEAPLFGYQPFEVVWQQSGRFIEPIRVTPKPQEWFCFDTDGNFLYKKKGGSGELPPPMKIINITYEANYLNPYGHALLSKCFWPVSFKKGGIRFWVNYMERYGMPMLIANYTRGATFDEINTLARELAGMTEDSVLVAPEDIDLKMHEPARNSSVNLFRDMIKQCNAEISKALLSQTLTTELDMGSYAASATHFKVRKEVIRSDAPLVEQAVNTLINYIGKLNFTGAAMPRFKLIVNDSDNMERIERDIKLTQAGLKFSQSYWADTYGIREEDIL